MALVAFERFFTGVCPNVSLKKPWPTERFATDLALTGKGVCSNVHLERAHGLVLFAAVLAAEIVVLVADNLEGLLHGHGRVVAVVVVGGAHHKVHGGSGGGRA